MFDPPDDGLLLTRILEAQQAIDAAEKVVDAAAVRHAKTRAELADARADLAYLRAELSRILRDSLPDPARHPLFDREPESRPKREARDPVEPLQPNPRYHDREPPAVEDLLHDALHSNSGAYERWEEITRNRPTDAQIVKAIRAEWSGEPASSSRHRSDAWTVRTLPGGTFAFWAGAAALNPEEHAPTLAGDPLVAAVRQIFGLGPSPKPSRNRRNGDAATVAETTPAIVAGGPT